MTDDKDVHRQLGDHGARLKGLEKGHVDTNTRVDGVDARQRSDVRKGLMALIGLLLTMLSGLFKWVGETVQGIIGQ